MKDIQEVSPMDLLGELNETERRYAPDTLFLQGDRSVFDEGPRVSIVGARKATEEGVRRAKKLARLLVNDGVVVVSGLAKGIDTAAHTGAIQAGGRTIAVVGTPLDTVYPRENKGLFDQIVGHHAAVSQFPIGYPGGRRNFVMRNRTMALLSEATVIIEASDTSGSLHQGWEAIRLGRLLFIAESVLERKDIKWPSELLEYGAIILNERNLQDVIEYLPSGNIQDIAL